MKKILALSLVVISSYANVVSFDVPIKAENGKCYQKVITPTTQIKNIKSVKVAEEALQLEVSPAKYDWVLKKIVIKEPEIRNVIIPATYKTITEEHLIEAGKENYEVVPAKYRTEKEDYVIKSNHLSEYRYLPDVGKSGVVCKDSVKPSVYTVNKSVQTEAARLITQKHPNTYRKIKRKVIDLPETVRRIEIPGEYKYIRTKVMVEPAKVRYVRKPPVYKRIVVNGKVVPSQIQWQEVICK
jgi:hypothetical protein